MAMRSGRRQLIAVGLLVAIGLVALAHTINLQSGTEAALRQSMDSHLRETVTLTARTLGAEMGNVAVMTDAWADRDTTTGAFDADGDHDLDQLRRITETLRMASPSLATTFVVDRDGVVLAADPQEPDVVGTDLRHRDWFTGAIDRDGPYISEAFRAVSSGQPLVVGVTTAVRGEDGSVLGIIGGLKRIDSLDTLTSGVSEDVHERMIVIDRRGGVIASRDAPPTTLQPSRDGRVLSAVGLPAGTTNQGTRLTDDDAWLWAAASIPATGGAVLLEVPESDVLATVMDSRRSTTSMAVGAGALLVGLAALVWSTERSRTSMAAEREARRRTAERSLAWGEAMMDAAPTAMMVVGPDGSIERTNAALRRITGLVDAHDLRGRQVRDVLAEDTGRGEQLTGPSGSRRWVRTTASELIDPDDRPVTLIAVHDVTEDLAERDTLLEAARTDPLTGLLNRSGFHARLTAMGSRLTDATLVLLDLDGFKAVNDRFGHAAGDRVLAEVAHRVRATMRAEDVVARIGGDEMVVLTRSANTPIQIDELIGRIRAAVATPVEIEGVKVTVGLSAGVATSADSYEPADLLVLADARMYAEKASHRHNGWVPEERANQDR